MSLNATSQSLNRIREILYCTSCSTPFFFFLRVFPSGVPGRVKDCRNSHSLAFLTDPVTCRSPLRPVCSSRPWITSALRFPTCQSLRCVSIPGNVIVHVSVWGARACSNSSDILLYALIWMFTQLSKSQGCLALRLNDLWAARGWPRVHLCAWHCCEWCQCTWRDRVLSLARSLSPSPAEPPICPT